MNVLCPPVFRMLRAMHPFRSSYFPCLFCFIIISTVIIIILNLFLPIIIIIVIVKFNVLKINEDM
jgi:hypothetical protein